MELALEQFMENMEASNRSLAEMVRSAREQDAAEKEKRDKAGGVGEAI